MPWNAEQQQAARLMASGSWGKKAKPRETTFRDVLRALGIGRTPLDLTSRGPEGVRPDYGLTGAGLSMDRRHPGEYLPGEATQTDVANALWGIVEASGMENVPGIGPHKTEQRAPGARVRPQTRLADGSDLSDHGLALNPDGTVTLYHGTTEQGAAGIRRGGLLKSAGEPDVYLTSDPGGGGYGPVVVPVRVKASQLSLDDEFPGGRRDFRLSARNAKVKF